MEAYDARGPDGREPTHHFGTCSHPSLSEQITPVLSLRPGGNSITGVFSALASDLHDRIKYKLLSARAVGGKHDYVGLRLARERLKSDGAAAVNFSMLPSWRLLQSLLLRRRREFELYCIYSSHTNSSLLDSRTTTSRAGCCPGAHVPNGRRRR
jgi:hypothetical protein